MNLPTRFTENITGKSLFSPKDKLLLAVSGGVDSVVLCELCKQAGYDFVIAHCNFQLRGEESNRDEAFVKELAGRYQVPFYVQRFDTNAEAAKQKTSVEETARNLRYTWFHSLVENDTSFRWIVTAHHADDNMETMLMHFFRGTGIKGLRGMPVKNGKVVRPLLFARRKEIEEFASANKLAYVTDSTNAEDIFTRNFFRNRLIPELKTVYPGLEQNLLHNLERFSETVMLYDEAIATHKKKLVESNGNEFHIPVLKLKKATPLRTIVYEIISPFGFSAAQTDEVVALLDSESGKYVASATHRVIRNRTWLIISPLATVQAENILIEEETANVEFAIGTLTVRQTQPAIGQLSTDNGIACLDKKDIRFPLLLRPWKTGDYFYPLGMVKKKKVARFLIDQKLSKTDKEKVWVIESDKRIIWVVGMRIDERFKVTKKTKGLLQLTFQNV